MTYFTVIVLCLITAMISITFAGHAFAPEQFPNIEWRQIVGWVMFALAIILLD